MDYFFLFSLFSIAIKNIKGFEQIELLYSSNNYYIPIKISKNEEEDHYIFSNMLAVNIFPSSKCDICELMKKIIVVILLLRVVLLYHITIIIIVVIYMSQM